MYSGKTAGIFFALSLMLITSCSQQSDQSNLSHSKNAQKYYESGQLAEALLEIKNALRDDPDNPEVRWLAGKIYLESGNNNSAVKELSKALELGLQRADADLPLVRAWMAQGKLQKALDYFKSKEIGTISDDARIIYTELLLQSGDILLAETILLKMRQSAPELMAVRLGLARIAITRSEQDNARIQIEEILKIEPENPFANLIAAELEIANRNFTEAKSYYDIALAAPKTRLQAELGTARILLAREQYNDAEVALDSILEKQPNIPLALFLKGLTYYHQNKFESAQEVLEQVQTMIPKHGPTLLLLGKIYLDNTRLEQANQVLTSLLTVDPKNKGGKQLLAATKLRLKQPEQALALIDKDKLEQTDNPLTLIVAGSAYIAIGDLSKGTVLLEKASTLVKNPELIRSQLARIYLASGDIQSAISEFHSLTESNHNNPQHMLMLAYAQVRQAQFDKAIITAEKLKQQGSELLATNLKGAIEMGRNQLELAQQHFETAISIDNSFIPARLNLARIAKAQKRNGDAKQLLEEILEIAPKHSEAVLGLAEILHRTDSPSAAIKLLKNFTNQHQSAKVLMLLANLINESEHPAKAIQHARQARDLAPTDIRIVSALAILQRKQGNLILGIETLLEIPKSQRDSTYNTILSQFARADDRPKLARESLSAALKQSPTSLAVIVNSISFELSEKNIERAKEFSALITQKNDPSGVIRLTLQGDISRASSDHQQAISAYTEAFKLKQSSNILNSLVSELLAFKQPEEATKVLSDWLDSYPNDVQALLRLSNQHMASGENHKAIKLYEQVLKVNPVQPLALNNLAWIYLERGNRRALTLANELAKLAIVRAETLDTVGWIYTNMGSLTEGIEVLKKANDLDPASAEVMFHLAGAFSRNNQNKRVENLLSILISEHPEYAKKEEVSSFIKQFRSEITN
ncbi:MAG: PEP-CTERM system TPR-repeat protein PrsT [Immundisolibacteraceae bacterium]|nr:PEP-CTERM system TPR-repeat protein PrsT [Immundisolibacteraceae bacterium]